MSKLLKHLDGSHYGLFINNRFVESASTDVVDSINPANGECWYQISNASAADVDSAVTAARSALSNPQWSGITQTARSKYLRKIGDLLAQHRLEPAIIAKIERAEVVADEETLNGILNASAGVMVARGDLGVEVGDAQLIGIQKEIISRARKMDRVVITATQMMESMINNPMPTRAEVFDVANAVLDGTDAVMLSAETAIGKYPVEVVTAMAEAALGAERHPVARTSRYRLDRAFSSAQETIAMSAIYAANHYSNVRGIACLTESGTTPLMMSRLSSGLPIFALSHRSETLQKLCLCRGVVPLFFDATVFDRDEVESSAIEFLLDGGYLLKGDSILLTRLWGLKLHLDVAARGVAPVHADQPAGRRRSRRGNQSEASAPPSTPLPAGKPSRRSSTRLRARHNR